MAAHQAPLSMGFSRQEYWSGVPLPSLVLAGGVCCPRACGTLLPQSAIKPVFCTRMCLVAQLCPTLCNPMDCSLPGSSGHGILWARILEWVAFPFSRGSSQPGIKPRSPTLQADSLPVELPRQILNHWSTREVPQVIIFL